MPDDHVGPRPMDYGLNYLPSIELIEHFAPFWIVNRMTAEQMRCDLLTMRAMNCRFVRFHIMPANPARDCFPGEEPAKSVADIAAAVQMAHKLGLHVHYDIWAGSRLQITEDEIRRTVERFRGVVDSYQIGNEGYHEWTDECILHVEKLVAAGLAADPSARWSLDIFPQDLARIRKEFPKLYAMLGMTLIHFYGIGGIGGWEPVYIEQMVRHCGGKDSRFDQMRRDRFVQSSFYVGEFGQFDKDLWITEITACGYHRYGAHVPEEVKAANWEQVTDALTRRTDVAVVGHHSFRDKMSWREMGASQCGMVWMDGTPKPCAMAFAKAAEATLPADDLARSVKATVSVEDTQVVTHLENRSDKPVAGKVHIEAFDGITVQDTPAAVTIPAGGTAEHHATIESWTATRQAAAHVFGVFEAPAWAGRAKTVVAWAWPKLPVGSPGRAQAVPVNTQYEPLAGVKYVGGVSAVADFFRRYPNPAIVTGDLIGFEAEMAYRLRSVIQAASGQMVDQVATITAARALDKPMIIIGNPSNNYLARVIEMLAEEECRVSAENRCFVAVTDQPFQVESRVSVIANAIGQAFCPACLYVAGADESALQGATYDLIRRLWVDESVPVSDLQRGQHPITGDKPATFRIDLDKGPYRLTAMVGQLGEFWRTTSLAFSDGQQAGPFITQNSVTMQTVTVEVAKDHLLVTFNAPEGLSWAVWGLELAHAGLLAEYHKLVFTSNTEAEAPTRNDILVTRSMKYSPARRCGWLD